MANPFSSALEAVGRWLMESPDVAPDPMDARWWNGGYAGGANSGQRVDDQTILQLDVVQAVLNRLGGTISSLPMMVFERMDDGTRRPAREHPLFRILHRSPNRRQTTQEFRDEQERHLALFRNFYCRILPDPITGYPIGELIIIHPSRVLGVAMGADGFVYYTVRRLDSGSPDVFREDDIWHVRRAPLTVDGLCGQPVWQTSRETLGYALAVRAFGALYFKNGGSGGGIIEHPGNFVSPAARKEFLETWREGGTGGNRHKDRLLLFGAKYAQNGVKNDEAQFIESKREANADVARLWGMPPHMVGILDKATFSNIEQQSLEYVVHTIAADVCAWEQGASRDLLIGDDQDRYFVELNVAGLLRGDLMNRMKAFATGRQWGWYSANDVRRFENMDPIGEAGDRYLEPMNMNPAGAPADDGEAQGAPGNPVDPTDNPNDPGSNK